MFTKWQEVEAWIRDNGLSSWSFRYDKPGEKSDDTQSEQKRSNRVAVLSDAFPGELDEKIMLTLRRLQCEKEHILYGLGRRGKENTGLLYCEVRLVDEVQQPGMTVPVSSPSQPILNEEQIVQRVRKECLFEFQQMRFEEDKKNFERERAEFESSKNSVVGALVHYFSPVVAAMGQKGVAGVDAAAPVVAQPVQPVQQLEVEENLEDELFTGEESDRLFELMARFKAVEPRFLELIESVVSMAERKDPTYDMAKGFLLK